MFRPNHLFRSIAGLLRDDTESRKVIHYQPRRAEFEPDEITGTLMPVYSEIAQRLSRHAYTSHGAA